MQKQVIRWKLITIVLTVMMERMKKEQNTMIRMKEVKMKGNANESKNTCGMMKSKTAETVLKLSKPTCKRSQQKNNQECIFFTTLEGL